MHPNPIGQDAYVRLLLAAYRKTPFTSGRVRPADRLLAVQLHHRCVPLGVIENAFILATARRLYRNDPNAPSLPPIGSLHYFLPLIDEVSLLKVDPAYFRHLRYKIHTFEEAKAAFLRSISTQP